MKEQIKLLLSELENLEKAADLAEKYYEANPTDKYYEDCFDAAYKEQFNKFIELSKKIAEFTGMTQKEARAVINGKREELKKLIA